MKGLYLSLYLYILSQSIILKGQNDVDCGSAPFHSRQH